MAIKSKASIKLELSNSERKNLRKYKIKKSEILKYAPDEFVKDLVFLGYYSIEELHEKNGAKLTDHYEKKKAYRIDPYVEDQFRLVVSFAKNENYSKKWWGFTNERKKYREEFGYPKDRP